MAALTCVNTKCAEPFEGRSNRRYCCPACRRHVEYLRARWDRISRMEDLPSELWPGVKATPQERRQMAAWAREMKSNLGDRP